MFKALQGSFTYEAFGPSEAHTSDTEDSEDSLSSMDIYYIYGRVVLSLYLLFAAILMSNLLIALMNAR